MLPNDVNLEDFVTNPAAADWRPYFNAAVAFVAANHPNGARIHVPAGRAIPLSYVDPILADNITFVGAGRAIWTADWTPANDKADIVALPTTQNMFTWGNNAYDPAVPGGFQQHGGGLSGLNFRMWDNEGALAVARGVVNPKFDDLWVWAPFNGILIENGLDPEIFNVLLEGYSGNYGVELNGTGVGTGPDPREGRGDRGIIRNLLVAGSGDETTPTALGSPVRIVGYWNTVMMSNIQVVKGGGPAAFYVGDRRNNSELQRPAFIICNDLQIDFVAARGLQIEDALDVWISGDVYLNATKLEAIRVDERAENVNIQNARSFAASSRVMTIAGRGVRLQGGWFYNWNSDGVSTEAAVYIEPQAKDVQFHGVTFGDVDLSTNDGSRGRKAIYSPANSSVSVTLSGCSFYGLHTDYVDGPNLKLNTAACQTDQGAAQLPGLFGKVFAGMTQKLAGSHAFAGAGDLSLGGSSASTLLNLYLDGGVYRYRANGAGWVIKNSSDGLLFQQAPAGTAGSVASLTTRAVIRDAAHIPGKLGIGIEATPGTSALSTSGDVSIGGGVPALFFNAYYDGSQFRFLGNGTAYVIKTTSTGLILQSFGTNASGAGAIASITSTKTL